MADKAHVLTDKEIEKMERHLSAIYSRAEKELSEKTDKYFERFRKRDEEKRKLLDAGKITQAEYDTWRRNQMMTGRHWSEMKRQAAHRLTQADQEAADYINGRLPSVYALNYNAVSDCLETRLKGYSFELVDANTVRNLATSDNTLLPYKYIDGAKAERWHTQRVNAEVLQGILQGESIPKIARRLRDNVGMSAYGSAVRNARTTVTSAENKGRMDMLHDAEEKGVRVEKGWLATEDSRTRESHRMVDGEFVGIDEEFSNGLMYPGDPDGAPEEVYNCFVGDTKIASDSEIVRSYKHEYSGKLVTVKTAGGVNFTCTPNHPILTIDGWVKAESLQNGDNLIVTFGQKNLSLRINPDVNHAFPRIDAIHEFLDKTGGKRTCSLSVDFHGDIPTSNVEIITEKRLLRKGSDPGAFNSINKLLLKHTNKSFLRYSTFAEHFWRVCKSTFCIVSGLSKAFPLIWRSLRHSEVHRLRPIALLYSGRVKSLNNDVARNAKLIGECLDGFSGVVFADNIISIDFSSGCSHVYNLQTENGYYFVNSSITQRKGKGNGIFAIAHNCRCTLVYEVKGVAKIATTYLGNYNEVFVNEQIEETPAMNEYEYWSEKEDRRRFEQIKNQSGFNEEKSEEVLRAFCGDRAEYYSIEKTPEGWFYRADTRIRNLDGEKWTKAAQTIDDYIVASPKYGGSIYRGLSLDSETVSSLQTGGVFVERGSLSSWSSSFDISKMFAEGRSEELGLTPVILQVEKHPYASPVSHLSLFGSEEQEVIVSNLHGKEYIITGIEERNGIKVLKLRFGG